MPPTPASSTDINNIKMSETSKENEKMENLSDTSIFFDNSPTDEQQIYNAYLDIPGISDQIRIPVCGNDSIYDLKQMIFESMETSLRTCFSLVIDKNIKINEYSKIYQIPGMRDGVVIRMIDEPYNLTEAITHISRFNSVVFSSTSKDDIFFGLQKSLSPTCLGHVLQYNPDLEEPTNFKLDESDMNYINESEPSVSLLLSPILSQQNTIKCLNDFRFAPWNPPIGPRKMSGDLLYLVIQTLEGKTLNITCCTNGFYINSSSDDNFDPRPLRDSYRAYTLVGLLSQISDKFKSNFAKLVRSFVDKNVYDFTHAPNLECKLWTLPLPRNEKNSFKSQILLSNVYGIDDFQLGHLRDWNEELQAIKDHKTANILDRIIRDRSLYKFVIELANIANRGTILLVNGCIPPLNPQDKLKDQLFDWNNLFFNNSCDSKGYFKTVGGDIAARTATSLDLHGADILNRLNIESLYCLATTYVDYYGLRILVQSIVPGIFQRIGEDIVSYGSTDAFKGTAVKYDSAFDKLLSPLQKHLKIRPVKFINNDSESPVTIYSPFECKGVIGNDGRHYLIDNYKILPPDPLFIDEKPEKSSYLPADFIFASDYTNITHNYSFPMKRFTNKLRIFREIFVDEFYTNEFVNFSKTKITQLDILKKKYIDNLKKASHDDNDNVDDIILTDSQTCDIEREANKIAASICYLPEDTQGFDLMVSPDCFNQDINIADEEKELMKRDRALCHRMSYYLVASFIPDIVSQMQHFTLYSGDSLTKFLHSKGVNMRYLGYVDSLIVSSPIHSIHYIHKICVGEMIIRASKCQFRNSLSSSINKCSAGHVISHYLNCFLGSFPSPRLSTHRDEIKISRRGKKNKKSGPHSNHDSKNEYFSAWWSVLTPEKLWKSINEAVLAKFGFNLDCTNIEQIKDKYNLTCVSLLRRFCQVHGIQVFSRDYDFSTTKHHTFYVDDIISINPIVKTINVVSCDASNAINLAKDYIASNNPRLLKLVNNMLSATSTHLIQIYGLIHPQVALVYEMMAKVCYLSQQFNSAVSLQKKAVLIFERFFGLDYHDTINSYVNLGLYLFSAKCILTGIKVMNRARYLISVAYGFDHPEMFIVDTNLSLMLSHIGRNDISVSLLKNAIRILSRWSQPCQNINYAVISLLLAKQQFLCSLYKDALQTSKESFKIFKTRYGVSHNFTIEALTVMENATKLAVTSERLSKTLLSAANSTFTKSYKNESINRIPTDVLDLVKVVNDLKIGSDNILSDKIVAKQVQPILSNERSQISVSTTPSLDIDVD